jgi:tRNA(Ile)-lysidine synthase
MADTTSAPADADTRLADAVGTALQGARRVVLAVSGGRDSMALLHAAARTAARSIGTVATFDHGTGPAASAGADLAAVWAARYGLPCRLGRAGPDLEASEAAWRGARWQFLREAAASCGARAIVTAHTQDDQIETVVIRILRHAGARGLAALDTDGDVVRPWLRVRRAEIAQYAARWGVPHVEDPSNASRAFLRNRVRFDLLPALRATRPRIDEELLACAAKAAAWRRDIERLIADEHPLRVGIDGVFVGAGGLERYDVASLAIVWQVLAAGAGVTLDRRGTERLSAFTREARVGNVTQVSGGFEVQRSRFSLVVRRSGYQPVLALGDHPAGARGDAAHPATWVARDEPLR